MADGWGDGWGLAWGGAGVDVPTIIAGVGGSPNLAIDVQPDVSEGSFTLDVSELDGPDLLAWGVEGWVNVVCNVTRVRIVRGATRVQGPLTRAEAALITVEILDRERAFDPLVNADAVHAGTPARVRVWGGTDPAAPDWSAILVTGEIEDVPVDYASGAVPLVTINGSDIIAELVAWSSEGRPEPGVGAGDTLRQRVSRVLTEAAIPTSRISADSDTGYAVTLAPSTLAGGWADIEVAQLAELGRVWADAQNRLVVRGRGSQLSGPVRGTLSDWHGETVDEFEPHLCYADLGAMLGTEQLINRTIGARHPVGDDDEPSVIQRDDTYSQARYRTRVGNGEQRDLMVETDVQVTDWCESLLLTSSRPQLRVDSVTPAPWAAPEAWQAVMQTDIGDRWVLRYHPAVGPTVRRTVGVLGIEHEITPEGWSIVWRLAPALTPGESPDGWFSLDVSMLDSGDVLAPFRGKVAALTP